MIHEGVADVDTLGVEGVDSEERNDGEEVKGLN